MTAALCHMAFWGVVGFAVGHFLTRPRKKPAPRYTEEQVIEAAYRSLGLGVAELARLQRTLREHS